MEATSCFGCFQGPTGASRKKRGRKVGGNNLSNTDYALGMVNDQSMQTSRINSQNFDSFHARRHTARNNKYLTKSKVPQIGGSIWRSQYDPKESSKYLIFTLISTLLVLMKDFYMNNHTTAAYNSISRVVNYT